jgi:hypothetical protein
MSDDKAKHGPADASRINVHEDYEVRHWTRKFGCTEAQLKAAVHGVGVMAENVEAYLRTMKTLGDDENE